MSSIGNRSRFSSLQTADSGQISEKEIEGPVNPFLAKSGGQQQRQQEQQQHHHHSSRWEGLRAEISEEENDEAGFGRRKDNVFARARASKAHFRRQAPKRVPRKAFCLEDQEKVDGFPALGSR